MKRTAFLVSAVLLVFAASIWPQTAAPKPGPEHQKIKMFVGHWTYEIEYKSGPWGPAAKTTGEYANEMTLGGFFSQGRWVEKAPWGPSRGVETFGYNPAGKNYLQSQYTDDGGMASGEITLNGNTWSYSGVQLLAGKQYKTRGTMTFAADLMSMTAKFETSADGIGWMPFWEAKFTKVKPAPKTK
ncbi:MAG TPA: DUF1579 family protein [Terriglobales bacterium]|nr:DUF1579 family protein [Terriglobales bacterium]